MANVIFKRGEHNNLPAINAAQDGVFYLTTDTHRLYVGQGTNLVELNKSITVVSAANQLPSKTTDDSKEVKGSQVAVGQFYYVNSGANSVSGNILAVCSAIDQSGNITWVQVNPDTNTDHNDNTWISSATAVKSVANNQIDVTLTINGVTSHPGINSNTETATPVTATFSLTQEDIGKVVVDTEVGVTGSVSGNDAIISTTGTGSKNTYKATFTEGTGINFSASNGKIKIDADTYKLSSAADSKSITLTKTNGSTSSTENVAFTEGTAINIDGTTAGQIQIKHANVSSTATTDTALQLGPSSTATVVTGITVNEQGHVTAVTTRNITSKDTTYTADSISADDSGNLSFGIKTGNVTSTASATGVLYHEITVDGSTTQVMNQQNLGNFYSTTKVNELISEAVAGLNAMTYKGTVGTTGATTSTLPTTATAANGIKVGDTYMASTSGTFAGQSADKGDLFIATGTETNGVITGAVTWQLVPSGDDTDTQYTFSVTNGSNAGNIQVKASTSSATNTIASIKGGTAISVAANTANNTITVAHNVTGANGTFGQSSTTAVGYSGTFTIPSITVDAQGHVTSASDKTITLPASVDSKYALSSAASTTANEANVVLTGSGSASGTTTARISGGTAIQVGFSDGKIQISHTAALATGTANQAYGATSTTALNAQGSFKVPQVTVNAQGHVTAVKEFTITLPKDNDTKFQLRATTVTATGTTTSTSGAGIATIKMSDTSSESSNQSTSYVIVKSNSLNVTKATETVSGNERDAINVDLIWGTF